MGKLNAAATAQITAICNRYKDEETPLKDMCKSIKNNKKSGLYNGAYEVVKLAMEMKKDRR